MRATRYRTVSQGWAFHPYPAFLIPKITIDINIYLNRQNQAPTIEKPSFGRDYQRLLDRGYGGAGSCVAMFWVRNQEKSPLSGAPVVRCPPAGSMCVMAPASA